MVTIWERATWTWRVVVSVGLAVGLGVGLYAAWTVGRWGWLMSTPLLLPIAACGLCWLTMVTLGRGAWVWIALWALAIMAVAVDIETWEERVTVKDVAYWVVPLCLAACQVWAGLRAMRWRHEEYAGDTPLPVVRRWREGEWYAVGVVLVLSTTGVAALLSRPHYEWHTHLVVQLTGRESVAYGWEREGHWALLPGGPCFPGPGMPGFEPTHYGYSMSGRWLCALVWQRGGEPRKFLISASDHRPDNVDVRATKDLTRLWLVERSPGPTLLCTLDRSSGTFVREMGHGYGFTTDGRLLLRQQQPDNPIDLTDDPRSVGLPRWATADPMGGVLLARADH